MLHKRVTRVLLQTILLLGGFLSPVTVWGTQPSIDGLQLWLDASDAATVVRDASGRTTTWRDKSGHGHDAVNNIPASNPRVVAKGVNGLDVLRFDGKQDGLEVAAEIRRKSGSLTVFVVSQRLEEQGQTWQRLISSNDGTATPDNRMPNVCMMATRDGNAKPYPPCIDDREFTDVVIQKLAIGRAAAKPSQFFAGDIAEILIYDRTFLSEDESRAVLDYLAGKWKAHIAREDRGWTRTGELGELPKRITDAYPLSDQQNKSNWVRNEELSDEFEGTKLDTSKWRPEYPGWKGRQPGRFSPYNVTVSNGKLNLTMRKEPISKDLEAPGYKDYTSAAVDSVKLAPYGYYEVMAKPMNSAGSSSFWFSRTDKPKHGTEIDVFEIGGKALGFERKLNMNLHVWETPQEKRHWSIGSAWIAPWRLADDYHVYGFQWDKDEIKYYVDGVIVRRIRNSDWHDPLHMQFDSETMPTWFGMPKDEDLPSTYSIEYVRAWRTKEESK
jgi:hypothetical protein